MIFFFSKLYICAKKEKYPVSFTKERHLLRDDEREGPLTSLVKASKFFYIRNYEFISFFS